MKSFKQYFNFSRKDCIGALFLILLILLTYLLPELYSKRNNDSSINVDSSVFKAINTLDSNQVFDHRSVTKRDSKTEFKNSYNKEGYTKGELFKFDPNTLAFEGWQKLGLSANKIQTIIHYRNKGGHFYKAEDLQKIWGLPEGFYNRIKEFIDIPVADRSAKEKKVAFNTHPKEISVDINLADTSDFMALNGIGIKLAIRILNFRHKLGGFYSIDQIAETYGLPDSTFQKIKPYLHINANEKRLKMVNINSADKEELKEHPYIKWTLANAIISYRNQHGPYLQLTDLKKIVLMTDSIYKHLEPYLTIQ